MMLQVSNDPEFQRKQWRIQRIGWAGMVCLVVAGALGAAGNGPISARTSAARGNVLTVAYDRFIRREAPTTIELRLGPGAGAPAIWLDAHYLDRVTIRSIRPVPTDERLGRDRHVFVFAPTAAADGGTITVELEPRSVGPLAGEAGLVSGPSVGFHHFVFP